MAIHCRPCRGGRANFINTQKHSLLQDDDIQISARLQSSTWPWSESHLKCLDVWEQSGQRQYSNWCALKKLRELPQNPGSE